MKIWKKNNFFLIALSVFLLTCCVPQPVYKTTVKSNASDKQDTRKQTLTGKETAVTGIASFYGDGFHGKKTASGEVYDQNRLTAAHRTLPFGTRVRVTNLTNNQDVIVVINDRGPFAKGRIIDLSYAAAKKIGMIQAGTAKVKLEIIE